MTDPHVHQKLHDHHAEKWGRYIGWWYNTDIWGLIDSQVYSYAQHPQMLRKNHINEQNNSLISDSNLQAEATKANSLIEACMAGCWLNFACMLAGLLLILIQKLKLKQKQKEMDR